MPDEEFFTEEDRSSLAYAACVATGAVAGLAVGAASRNPVGIVAGAVAGGLYATAVCKRRSVLEYFKKRLSSNRGPMSEGEYALLKDGVRKLEPHLSDDEVRGIIESAAKEAFA